jgi:hypothetical protein
MKNRQSYHAYFIIKSSTVFVAVLFMISGQIIGVFHCSPIQGYKAPKTSGLVRNLWRQPTFPLNSVRPNNGVKDWAHSRSNSPYTQLCSFHHSLQYRLFSSVVEMHQNHQSPSSNYIHSCKLIRSWLNPSKGVNIINNYFSGFCHTLPTSHDNTL